MELTKTNGFCEMNEMEMQEVDGGAIGLLKSLLIGYVVDGLLIAITGKSGGEWFAELIGPEDYY